MKKKKEKKIKSLVKGPLIKNHKPLSFNFMSKMNKDTKKEANKRYNILIFILTIFMTVLIIGLFVTQVVRHDYYASEIKELSLKTVEGPSAPRGRIYDRNGNILVDNKASKVIYYQKPSGVTTQKEIKTAYKLSNMINLDINKLTDYNLKYFWIINHQKAANNKITDEEWQKLEERKLTNDDILKLKIERVSAQDLASFNDNDKKAALIYSLMNTGYSYDEKVIKDEGVTDQEYAMISENISKLNGVNTKLDWERVYPYGDTFKTFLGNVSSSKTGIPSDLKKEYLDKGYSLNDRVGTSYIEYQYESLLKGTKNKYKVLNDGSYKLVREGKRGKDIVLSIDINLQKAVDDILTKEVIATKKEANTEYYNRSFVIITDPNTGEILAISGKQIQNDGSIVDYTPGTLTSPVVMGSVVKGASQIVGYNTGALKIGEVRYDTCVKIAATPEKCSWKYLGRLNDITALAQSSNTYQFYTAIKVGHGNYKYNKPLTVDKEAFTTYRNTFAEFGLGVKTGIDLPVESLGYKGTSTGAGHLLDFAIGQYDTYTPVQLAQYIGTIANGGSRLQLHLYKGLYDKDASNHVKDPKQVNVLNKVNTKPEYMDRIHQGFEAVLKYGTGAGYISMAYKPAGKTGTSQSFIDTDGDGVVDKETISTTFTSYAPYDNPKVTFTIISPDVSRSDGRSNHQSNINKRIALQISQKYFELYK